MEKIPSIIDSSWHEYLQPLFDDKKMALTKQEVFKVKFLPDKQDIFKVFKMPIHDIKVVILGQDPYPKKGQANGLSFAVNKDIDIPPSLKIIHKEIIAEGITSIADRTLEAWFKQGVFLLNSALTVQNGVSGSHLNYWHWFTKDVIKIISIQGNNPIWLMWGAKAKGYIGFIHSYYKWHNTFKGNSYNYVLEADHPAAETYPSSKYKFSGCNHFVLCNNILREMNKSPINW